MADPTTKRHYAANGNFVNGQYAPAVDGFNLADLSSLSVLNSLPSGVDGLVYLGMVNGADSAFQAAVSQYIGNPKLYGFYLVDEPDPTGKYGTLASAANLKAESDWIHAHVPGAKTFIVMMNMGSDTNPSYANTYNPANTDIDYFGLDPYPVRPQFSGGVNYAVIPAAVSAAEAAGIPLSQIVPVYQTFGGGGYSSWGMPTAAQEQQLLATWGSVVPAPAFDMAYSWGAQNGDTALADSPDLQKVLAAHNAGAAPPPIQPPPPVLSSSTMTATDRNGVTATIPVIASGAQDFTGPLAGAVHQVVAAGIDTVSADVAITSEIVVLGSGTQKMSFIGSQSVTVTGGSGTDTVTAQGSRNRFIVGTGTLDVTGSSGRDAYVFHAGGGLIRIEDFSVSQRDSITVDQALRGTLQQTADGHGGVMLTFGTAGHGIDIANLTSFPASAIRYA